MTADFEDPLDKVRLFRILLWLWVAVGTGAYLYQFRELFRAVLALISQIT